MAVSGHKTLALVAHYTQAVEQERLARDAMAMLGGRGTADWNDEDEKTARARLI